MPPIEEKNSRRPFVGEEKNSRRLFVSEEKNSRRLFVSEEKNSRRLFVTPTHRGQRAASRPAARSSCSVIVNTRLSLIVFIAACRRRRQTARRLLPLRMPAPIQCGPSGERL